MSRGGRRRRTDNPRALAVAVLRDIERRRGFSNRILSEHLERHSHLDPRDRGLVTSLVYGTLRHRLRLDALIDAVADRPAGIKGEVREILRLATFELRELEHPLHAVASEAAYSSQALDPRRGLHRLIHAIAGRIDREGAKLDAQLERGRPLDVLERRWSIPRWWGGRWLAELGPERALARARAFATVPPVELRVDLGRSDPETIRARLEADHPGIAIQVSSEVPGALQIRGGGDVFHGPIHDEGLISVQSLASQQAARRLAPPPGSRVLEACAGLGVKTLQLIELMQHRGVVVAVDSDARKLERLEHNLDRGRVGPELERRIVCADLTDAHVPEVDDGPPFSAILLDAPCTGLGNVARHPEIRWMRSYEDIGRNAVLQRQLLHRCVRALAPGGRLVYAVCSLEPEEGPQVVESVAGSTDVDLIECHRRTPEDHGTEGFFTAVLHKPS